MSEINTLDHLDREIDVRLAKASEITQRADEKIVGERRQASDHRLAAALRPKALEVAGRRVLVAEITGTLYRVLAGELGVGGAVWTVQIPQRPRPFPMLIGTLGGSAQAMGDA